jgi:hypothetical protein
MTFELERLGPVTQCDQAIDALVVTFLVERGVKRDAPSLRTFRQASRADGSVARMRALAVRSASLVSLDASARSTATATIGAEAR